MAKVLLINSNRFKHPWPVIPSGLCSVATVLESVWFHNVFLLDLCFSNDCQADIIKVVKNFVPDIIGISIRNIDDTGGYHTHFLLEDVRKDVVDHCKLVFTGPIVIGGPSAGISSCEMLEYFDLEYAIPGDGEAAMPEFVKRIENRESLEGMQGLVIRRDKRIIQDSEPLRVHDLDSLPFPKPLRYLDLDQYSRFGSPLQIQTKRGCAFRCSYCTYNKIEGSRYRLRDPSLVADEIELLVTETGIRHIEFTDSIFNSPLPHAKRVLRAVISKKLDLKLHTMGLSPAMIDEELVDLMHDAGFNEVDVGAESASDKILEDLGKDFTCSDVLRTAALLKEKKIPVTWFIILGAPSENRESVLETLNTIGKAASAWDLVFISTGIRLYKGAELSNKMIENDPHCTGDMFLRPVKLEPGKITLEEIHFIAKEFSFRYPNFYLYEKEHIIAGWALAAANFILKVIHSRQPVWRLLILLRIMERFLGITLIKRSLHSLKMRTSDNKKSLKNGFSLVRTKN